MAYRNRLHLITSSRSAEGQSRLSAADHGEEFTENDWVALVQELARRCAGAPEIA